MRSNRELLRDILKKIKQTSYINPDSIPGIALYMDQVTTFMEENLSANKRYPSDKALTKTMINNYTKNRLLPAPVKKKYSKEHLLMLIFIYYYKNLLSFSDIENIFKPLTNMHFSDKHSSNIDLEDIYKEVLSFTKSDVINLQKDIVKKFNKANKSFKDAKDNEREFLILFTFICELAFDIYIKKQIIEQISDYLSQNNK